MGLRISQLVLQLVMLDEFDAPKQADPIIFTGDADLTAVAKLQKWLSEIDLKLIEAELSMNGSSHLPVPLPPPLRAPRKSRKDS